MISAGLRNIIRASTMNSDSVRAGIELVSRVRMLKFANYVRLVNLKSSTETRKLICDKKVVSEIEEALRKKIVVTQKFKKQ